MAMKTRGTSKTNGTGKANGTSGTKETKTMSGTRTRGTSKTKATKRMSDTTGRKTHNAPITSDQDSQEVMIQQKDDELASKQEQIESLLKEKSDLETTVSELKDIIDFQEVIRKKDAELASLRQINQLSEEIRKQEKTIHNLKGTISDQQVEIKDLETKVDGLKATTKELETKVLKLNKQLEPHQDFSFDKFKTCFSKVGKENGDNDSKGDKEDVESGKENKSNKGTADDKVDTINRNNAPSKRALKDTELESHTEPKKQRTRAYIKQQHEILSRSEQNFNVVQQYSRNDEKAAEKKNRKVALQPSHQNAIASTSPVKMPKTPEKPPAPLARYCTQKCLLGLKKNLPMDEKCPNYNIHKRNSRDKKLHPINCNKLVSLFTKQLESHKTAVKFYDSKEGTVGVMTKYTIYPYGYTVVGKNRFFAYDYNAGPLKYEAAIYKQIEDLQGKWIPVCLGYVETYFQNCILLSYGGENPETEEDYNEDTVWKIDKMLEEHGVDHNDIRPGNIVLSKELGHEMLIDFHVSNCYEVDKADYYTMEDGKYLY